MTAKDLPLPAKSLALAIVAGGKSRRMGTDKAFVELGGKALIEIVLLRAADISEETFIITNRPTLYAHLGFPTYSDIIPDLGPLGGLYTALKQTSKEHVFLLACDMPWLNRPLLNYMASLRHEADVIVPRWTPHPEPLQAVYSQNCLGPVEDSISAGNLQMVSFYDLVKVRYLERKEIAEFDARGESFANVNSIDELTAARRKDADQRGS